MTKDEAQRRRWTFYEAVKPEMVTGQVALGWLDLDRFPSAEAFRHVSC